VIRHLQGDDPILTNGPQCAAFEAEWSNGWASAAASSSTPARRPTCSMAVLKIHIPRGRGDRRLPGSPISRRCCRTASPVFADIDPRTLSMDTRQILAKVTDRTRAVFLTLLRPGLRRPQDELLAGSKQRGIR
jgi:CDP-6-deoxy-D-xylo-4-hexulose-3-dehydrase